MSCCHVHSPVLPVQWDRLQESPRKCPETAWEILLIEEIFWGFIRDQWLLLEEFSGDSLSIPQGAPLSNVAPPAQHFVQRCPERWVKHILSTMSSVLHLFHLRVYYVKLQKQWYNQHLLSEFACMTSISRSNCPGVHARK